MGGLKTKVELLPTANSVLILFQRFRSGNDSPGNRTPPLLLEIIHTKYHVKISGFVFHVQKVHVAKDNFD